MKNSSITRNTYCLAMILFVAAILTSHPVVAATYYVATTGNDSNPGTQAQPWLTLQKAANTVVAGDTVYIRGGTYSSSSILQFSRSGTSGNLITWKPEPSSGTPVIRFSGAKQYDRAIIELFGVSYNRFESLTFGGPSGSLTDQALKFYATNSPDFNSVHSNTRGNQVVGNTFSNIGHNGTGGASYPGAVTMGGGAEDTLVDGNTFTGNYGTNIVDAGGYKNTISNNTLSNMHGAQFYGDFSYPQSVHGIWISASSSTWSPGSNLKVGGFDLVQGNTIDGTGANVEASGVRCDAGSHNLTIKGNRVKNLGAVGDTGGIYMESRCMNNSIVDNIVVNSRNNFAFSNAYISSSQYNSVINNVSYNGMVGFALANVGRSIFKNNISISNSLSQITVSSLSVGIGSNTFSNNLYWKSGSSLIGLWNCTYAQGKDNCFGNSATLSLASWNTASGETNSISANPLFVSLTSGAEDFHLQSSSPAIGKGEGGIDMGAYPNASHSAVGLPTIAAPFGSKIVDGDAADWNGISSFPIAEVCPTCTAPATSDLAANFRVAWDNTYLYVLAEIGDNEVDVTGGSQIYENDGIEVMIDGLRDHATSYGSDDHQIFVQADGVTGGSGHVPGDGKIVAAARQRVGGYTIEVAIRWDFIGGNPPVGDQFYGFDVAVNDRDNQARTNQLSWKYAASHWQDTSGFGDLKLQPGAGVISTLVAPTNLSVKPY